MLRPSDIALGRYLLVRGIVPRASVEECLAELGRSDGSVDLGLLLANRQLIDRDDIQRLYTESQTALREQAHEDRQPFKEDQPTLIAAPPSPTTSASASKEMQSAWRRASLEDQVLAQMCLQRQLVDPTIITPLMQTVGDATRSSSTQTLGQQLVRSRHLDPATYAALRNEIHASIFDCPRCSYPLYSAPTPQGHKVACPSCHSEVAIPPLQQPASAPGSGSARHGQSEVPPSSGSARGLGSTSRVRRQIKGPPPCGETFGPYEIIRELGKGSTGTVYVGCDLRTNAEVAIKIFDDELSPRDQRRLALQSTLERLRQLDHPNLLPITDDGEREGRLYCVMPIIQGRSLNDLLRNEVDLEFGMEILEKVCRAVQYAHNAGLIHGDLKPQNVILTRDGEPRVTDFGFATALERRSDLSKPGVVIGTPYYMAPETVLQPKAERSEASDIFSLGVIMYELLTGRLPFVGRARAELRRRILQDDPEPPRRLRPSLTSEVEAVCLRCLDKAHDERYESAASLADDIKKLLQGKPVDLPMRNRIRMTLRRYRRRLGTRSAILGTAGVISLVLLASLLVARYLQHQKNMLAQRNTWETRVAKLQSDIDSGTAATEAGDGVTDASSLNSKLRALNQVLIRLLSAEQKISRAGDPPITAYNTEAQAADAEARWQTLYDDLKACRTLVRLTYAAASLEGGDELALKQAREYLDTILEQQPNHPAAHAIETRFLAIQGEHVEALEELTRVIRNPRGDVHERLAWAKTAAWLEDWKGVSELLSPVLRDSEPAAESSTAERHRALLLRARAFQALGKRQRALADINAALQDSPTDTDALLLRAGFVNDAGDETAAETDLAAAQATAPLQTALARAKIELTNGWLENAEAVIDQALDRSPTNADALLTRATIRLARLNEKGAREDVDTLLATTPEHDRRRRARARALLSTIALAGGNHARALELATEANHEWPRVPLVLRLLGHLYLEGHHQDKIPPEAAETIFKTLKEIRPTSGHADLGLGLALLLKRDERPSKPLQNMDRAIYHLRFSARAWQEKATILDTLDDPRRRDEGLDAWQRARQLLDDPRSQAGRLLLSGIAWKRRITTLERRRALAEQSEQTSLSADSLKARLNAETSLHHALVHGPTNKIALVKIAELDSLAKQWSRALSRLDEIPTKLQEDLNVILLRTQLEAEKPDGDPQLVMTNLRQLRSQLPGSPRLAAIKASVSIKRAEFWDSTPNAAARSNFEQALSDIDMALRASSNDPTALPPYPSTISRKALSDQRSTLLRKLGRRDEALQAEDKAKRRAQAAQQASRSARGAFANLEAGRRDLAIKQAQGAINLNPEGALGHAALCAALRPSATANQALRAGLTACLLDPSHQKELELVLLHPRAQGRWRSISINQSQPAKRDADALLRSTFAALMATAHAIDTGQATAKVTIEEGIDAANVALENDRWFAPALAARAALLAAAGRPEEARRDAWRVVLLTGEAAPYSLLLLARIALTEQPARHTRSIRWLRKAIEAGLPRATVKNDSAFTPLHLDPRFQELIADG